ncbi:cGMP-dependent protein kinase [Aureococcus anophagefferens]|nr:cGMP-dependent protein kinase [Aureococcus anophagefferens]
MGGAASRTQAAAPAPAAGRSGSIVGPNPQLDAETQEMIRETQRRGSGQQRKASWGLFTGGERRKSKEVVLSQEAELQTESYAEAMRLIKQQQEELARLRNENRKVQAELAAAKELLGDRDLARMDGKEKAATRDLRGSAGYIAPPKTQPSGSKASTTTKSRRESARRKVIRNFADDLALSRPEVVPKGDGVRDLIWNVCKENLLFSDLDDSCRDRLTDPFAPIECGAGEVVVRQGENGEHFYVVESGHLRVFVKGDEEEEESKAPEASSKEPWDLAMYESHDALGKYVLSVGACGGFGELALMYDTPRAATVIACGDCKLWAIKRSDCKSVLQSIQRAEMKGRVRFLRRVRIGAATGSDEPLGLGEFLTDQELARLASVLESEVVGEGEIIIRQGEPGNHFYIVEEGRVDVHRNEPRAAAGAPSRRRSPSVVVPEPNPDEDDFTLDLTEKEDDAARPDWCPRLPKTMHKWRPTKADDAVNELAAGSPKASPWARAGASRRLRSPGREPGAAASAREPASSPSSPASPAARSLRD